MIEKNRERPEPVERDRAREHALLASRREWAGGVPGFEGWHAVEVDPEPLVLHDLNGWPLFYEFLVRRGNSVVGSIKTAASRLVGAPVLTLEHGPLGWDPDRARREAEKSVRQLSPNAEILGTELVCYAYPKVGVRVDLKERGARDNRPRSLIFDAADFSPVSRFGADELEGKTAYSFYHEVALRQAEKNLRRFALEEQEARDRPLPPA